MNGDFIVRLTAEGLDGVAFQRSYPVKVTGVLLQPDVSKNQRYVGSSR
jgi:hypothetical protein